MVGEVRYSTRDNVAVGFLHRRNRSARQSSNERVTLVVRTNFSRTQHIFCPRRTGSDQKYGMTGANRVLIADSK